MSPSKGLPAPSSPTGLDMAASSHNPLPSYQQGSTEEGRGQAGGAGSCPRLGRVLCRGWVLPWRQAGRSGAARPTRPWSCLPILISGWEGLMEQPSSVKV